MRPINSSRFLPIGILLTFVFVLFSLLASQHLISQTTSAAAAGNPYIITDASVNYIVINGTGFAPVNQLIEVNESVTWHNATDKTHILIIGTPPDEEMVYLPIIVKDGAALQSSVPQFSETNEAERISSDTQAGIPLATILPGEDFTLTYDTVGTYDYYLETAVQFTNQIVVQEPGATIIERTSPANGEGQVSVARETIIEFDHPLDPNSVTDAAIYAQFGGTIQDATLHISPDNKKVTLFYDQPLPASARVRLTIDGNQLADENGDMVDADGDGQPGGVSLVDFDTLAITVIPGTSVCGTVYASELGDDGNGGTVDVPLEGTTITVDGMEDTLFTVTDGNGDFCLDPAPAGRFFVHIDGRTATVGVPPGAYYPYVGKAWQSTPGNQTSVGIVHLPLVVPGTLQPVSATEETTVNFPQTILDEFPEFSSVAIMVPSDSLYANDGTRGGQVGIAPVPSDRLPGTLPEDLRFPLVITVQTDGATNFDTPAPVCFPNLPDPDTSISLQPGAKATLWSFNHDTGRFEAVGMMTVSDDGSVVCTDPGIGVLAPGWHSVIPPKPYVKAPVTCQDDFTWKNAFKVGKAALSCFDKAKELVRAMESIANLVDAGIDLQSKSKGLYIRLINGTLTAGDAIAGIESLKAFKSLMESLFNIATGFNPAELTTDAVKCVGDVSTTLAGQLCDSVFKCSENAAVKYLCTEIVPELKFLNTLTQKIRDLIKHLKKAPLILACLSLDQLIAELEQAAGQNSDNRAFNATDIIEPTPELIALWETFDNDLATFVDPLAENLDEAMAVAKDLEHALGEANSAISIILTMSGGFTDMPGILRLGGPPSFTAEKDITLYPNDPKVVPPGMQFQMDFYNAQTKATVRLEGDFPDNGSRFESMEKSTLYLGSPKNLCPGFLTCPPVPGQWQPTHIFITDLFFEEDELDSDNDDLSDVAEGVFGTNPADPDTDGDGILDGAEVAQGLNPLDGFITQTGIIASVDTPGTAVDICALNNLAIVADSEAGLSVFNINNGQTPIAIAQVNTPGSATRVTCAKDVVAVADGSAGLAIVDIVDPPAAFIAHQLDIGNVKAVVSMAGIVYAGAADGSVTAVNLQDGAVIDTVNIGEPVLDIQLGRDVLYAYAKGNLYTISLLNGMAVIDNDPAIGTFAGNETLPLRIFVGDDIAYTVHRTGYNTFDLSDPTNPLLIANGNTTQFGWRQIVDNGSGLGLATVGNKSTPDGPHHVSLYDVSDAAQTNEFLTAFETPGLATAVSIYNGLAYVADGNAGLQVINYRAYDALGIVPTIMITTNTDGNTVEEGKVLHFGAEVNDDVQVRNVTFYIDGQQTTVDGNFPFAYRSITPLLSQQSTVALTAKATDTGGNLTWATPITLSITPDATPPLVNVTAPNDGAALYNTAYPVTAVSAIFNEPIDPSTLTANSFQLFAAGTDGVVGTGDDIEITGGTISYQEQLNMVLMSFATPLPVDQYQGVISGTVSDMAGNTSLTSFTWQFQVTSGAFGEWDLSSVIPFVNPQAAHFNPVDGLIYVGRRGTGSDGLYRIELDDNATLMANGDNIAAVAVDPQTGNIFVSEDFGGIIYRTEITGTNRTTWVSGFHADDDDVVGMAFAPALYSGTVISPGDGLVVDRGSSGADEVWRFSPDVAQGETAVHSDDGTLVDSVDIAIDLNDVYLVDDKDAGVGVIYRLNADGSLVTITPTTTLPAPQGIAIDPVSNDLFILDNNIQQIVQVNPTTGDVVNVLPGFIFDFLATPWAGIDISSDGQQLVISDAGADMIYVFTRAD